MEIILMTGIAIFLLSTVYFALRHRKAFNTAALVSLVTVASYIVMLEGTFALTSADGETVFYTRWLFYALSCSLLMYEIGRSLKFKRDEIATLVYLIIFVMITGTLAAVFTHGYMLAMFVVSSLAFSVIVYKLVKAKSKNVGFVMRYIVFGWAIFPIFFILAPEGYGFITAATSAGVYLALDIFTKIIFYLDSKSQKSLEV